MSHSVRRHLNLEIEEYDRSIRQFIPGYEAMLERAAAEVAATSPARVVDLGAGTGALSEALLRHAEVGSVELLDVDPEMLERARGRLAGHGDRARYTLRSFDEPLPGCEAFTATLALHHIPTIEAKREFFVRLFDALPPGGVLANGDCNMPAGEREQTKLYRFWADHLVASGIPEKRAWALFDEWRGEDTYFPLDVELDALRQAGFTASRVWNSGPIGVIVARKPD